MIKQAKNNCRIHRYDTFTVNANTEPLLSANQRVFAKALDKPTKSDRIHGKVFKERQKMREEDEPKMSIIAFCKEKCSGEPTLRTELPNDKRK